MESSIARCFLSPLSPKAQYSYNLKILVTKVGMLFNLTKITMPDSWLLISKKLSKNSSFYSCYSSFAVCKV